MEADAKAGSPMPSPPGAEEERRRTPRLTRIRAIRVIRGPMPRPFWISDGSLRPPSVSLAPLWLRIKPLHHRDAMDAEGAETGRTRKAALAGSERALRRREPPLAIPSQPAVHQRIRSDPERLG